MSLHYFIDGYNLVWSTDRFDGKTLRDQRERLLKFLEERLKIQKINITVVFDGKADVESPPWKGSVRVRFSPGKDADRMIKQAVDDLANASQAVVVTNDREIQKWVRGVKAGVMSCEDFLKGPAKKIRGRAGDEKPHIDAAGINAELKRIWKVQ